MLATSWLCRYVSEGSQFSVNQELENVKFKLVYVVLPLALQEFMILPVGAPTFSEAMRYGAEVYHHLKVCF